jgi:hypothetical protein
MRADPVVEKDVPGLEESGFVDEHLRRNRLFLVVPDWKHYISMTYMLATKVLDKVSTHNFMRVCITTIDHLKELNVVDSETRMKL